MRTGSPIVYTSADSVFQIAAHEEVIPLWELYKICETAREILRGPHEVGRVIARPFVGAPGAFTRTANRHDYAVPPPQGMLLDQLEERGVVRAQRGQDLRRVPGARHRESDQDQDQRRRHGARPWRRWSETPEGLIFVNLVDFDMLYGHRNDVEGYGARARSSSTRGCRDFEAAMSPGDLVIFTADHGCDPTTPSTDHSREYVPLLAYGPRVRPGVDLGMRAIALRYRPDRGRKFRNPDRERTQAFWRKSYEKTSHGGQLEDVQDARGNHRILREIPAAGREEFALRDRDLSSFHESRRGRRRRARLGHSDWRAEHRVGEGRRLHRRDLRSHAHGRGRKPCDHRPQRTPPVFRRDR